MKVRDVMNTDPVTCQAGDPVSEAAKLLKENGISGMPVLEGESLVGVVSESDLLRLLATEDEKGGLWLPSPFEIFEVPIRDLVHYERIRASLDQITRTRVSDVMVKRVHVIGPEAPVEEAAAMMVRHHINRLPVMEEGRLVGIVTRGDIIEGLGESA
ncbi:MAG: CBS domain-containing protein [Methanosarcinales archaeon]|nr:CBS domain-containing protein [Methanosarcinales archaeon]